MSQTARHRRARPPKEYAASTIPGVEGIAAQEIQSQLKNAQIVEQRRGWVVFRCQDDAASLLRLRTVEDVFVVLFHTAKLPPRRQDALTTLTRMAAKSRHWDHALTRFHQAQTRSVRRITFRVIAQMTGRHPFRRSEARDAVLAGAQKRWKRWKQVADDAHLELWTPIIDRWALIAIRLSDRRMRHRTYKQAHLAASLRPTLAAAMVRLTHPQPGDRFCDPMCGAGTILAERALAAPYRALIGGDIEVRAVQAARANLRRVDDASVHWWDARRLPVRTGVIDALVSNLPFGEQIGSHEENPALYDQVLRQLVRVLKRGGRAVLLTSEKELIHNLIGRYPQLTRERQVLVAVLGKAARIYVLRKIGRL